MLIGVVADTHVPRRARKLPLPLLDALRGTDLILHCGDWSAMEAYRTLSEIAPVDGVAGNTDGPEMVSRFGLSKLLEIEGKRIGIVHGHQGKGRTTADRAFGTFADARADLVLFGHSHIPMMETRGGTVLLNPGSPTDKRRQPRYSFGFVTLADGRIAAEIVYFN